MHSSDVHEWIEAYERSHRKQDEGHLELDRLGLITRNDDLDACDLGLGGQWNHDWAPWEQSPPSRPLQTATRLALLVGTATIAALAIFFG
jgi:hypothetical protein